METPRNVEQRTLSSSLPDRSHVLTSKKKIDIQLEQYVTSVLTEDPTTVLESVKQIRRLLSQSTLGYFQLVLEDGQYVDDVIQTGVIPTFVKFLSYDSMPKLQFEAVWALTNIASGTSEQVWNDSSFFYGELNSLLVDGLRCKC